MAPWLATLGALLAAVSAIPVPTQTLPMDSHPQHFSTRKTSSPPLNIPQPRGTLDVDEPFRSHWTSESNRRANKGLDFCLSDACQFENVDFFAASFDEDEEQQLAGRDDRGFSKGGQRHKEGEDKVDGKGDEPVDPKTPDSEVEAATSAVQDNVGEGVIEDQINYTVNRGGDADTDTDAHSDFDPDTDYSDSIDESSEDTEEKKLERQMNDEEIQRRLRSFLIDADQSVNFPKGPDPPVSRSCPVISPSCRRISQEATYSSSVGADSAAIRKSKSFHWPPNPQDIQRIAEHEQALKAESRSAETRPANDGAKSGSIVSKVNSLSQWNEEEFRFPRPYREPHIQPQLLEWNFAFAPVPVKPLEKAKSNLGPLLHPSEDRSKPDVTTHTSSAAIAKAHPPNVANVPPPVAHSPVNPTSPPQSTKWRHRIYAKWRAQARRFKAWWRNLVSKVKYAMFNSE